VSMTIERIYRVTEERGIIGDVKLYLDLLGFLAARAVRRAEDSSVDCSDSRHPRVLLRYLLQSGNFGVVRIIPKLDGVRTSLGVDITTIHLTVTFPSQGNRRSGSSRRMKMKYNMHVLESRHFSKPTPNKR